jgi:hypothetical protein
MGAQQRTPQAVTMIEGERLSTPQDY